MPAKKVSIINMKGGVGKTTLSFNLSMYLSKHEKKKVLLIDLDPQANATILGIEESKLLEHKRNKKTIVDLFVKHMRTYGPFDKNGANEIDIKEYTYEAYVSPDAASYLHIIPSDIYLSSVLRGVTLGPYDLKKSITEKANRIYDYIVVDCAPTYSILTTLALNATDSVLIPVMADSFGVYGVTLMETVLKEHKHDFDKEVGIVGLVFTMWDGQKQNQVRFRKDIVKKWGTEHTFRSTISRNEWYKVANGRGEMFVESKAHQEAKDEFVKFVQEFMDKA